MFNKKTFLRYGGYNNNLKEAEDYEIISKIIKREKIYYLPIPFIGIIYTKKIFQNLKKIFNYKKN